VINFAIKNCCPAVRRSLPQESLRDFGQDDKKRVLQSAQNIIKDFTFVFKKIDNVKKEFIWDFYAGLNVGFKLRFNKQAGTSPLIAGFQIGGRYFWNRNWGINLQLGGGLSYGGRVGISRKL